MTILTTLCLDIKMKKVLSITKNITFWLSALVGGLIIFFLTWCYLFSSLSLHIKKKGKIDIEIAQKEIEIKKITIETNRLKEKNIATELQMKEERIKFISDLLKKLESNCQEKVKFFSYGDKGLSFECD